MFYHDTPPNNFDMTTVKPWYILARLCFCFLHMCMYLAEMMSLIGRCMYHLLLHHPRNRATGKRAAPGHFWLRWCRVTCGNCPAPLQCSSHRPQWQSSGTRTSHRPNGFFSPEKETTDSHTYKVISHICTQECKSTPSLSTTCSFLNIKVHCLIAAHVWYTEKPHCNKTSRTFSLL